MNTETVHGIGYSKPAASLLHASPLVNAEIAGRTAYDSFQNSEHEQVRNFTGEPVEDIEKSELMTQLCHVYFHDSVAEHVNLTYRLQTSRGVLQQIVRHRLASYTVRSTRYTMSSIINAFVASLADEFIDSKEWFIEKFLSFDILVTTDVDYNKLEASSVYDKLYLQYNKLKTKTSDDEVYDFFKIAVAKSSLEFLQENKTPDEMFKLLESGKKKRNVGDAFKHIVNDNWKVDLVVTFNLRSLKNYFELRASGSSYFQIQWLAEEMVRVTPRKYLDLIMKQDKINKILAE